MGLCGLLWGSVVSIGSYGALWVPTGFCGTPRCPRALWGGAEPRSHRKRPNGGSAPIPARGTSRAGSASRFAAPRFAAPRWGRGGAGGAGGDAAVRGDL